MDTMSASLPAFLGTLMILQVSSLKNNCGGKPADVYFLLDSSSSIWSVDYTKQLGFVGDMINLFDISPESTRVGMGIFSSSFQSKFSFSTYEDKESMVKAVNRTRQWLGGTNTAEAIRRMRDEEFVNARKNVAHVAIVMTDGRSWNPRETAREARLTKEKGIYIFAIGIGRNADRTELEDIGSRSDSGDSSQFVFAVKSFDALSSIKQILAIKTCEVNNPATESPKDQPRCSANTKADILFAIDPLTLGPAKSQILREFVAQMVDELDIGVNANIRAGVFSNNCPESKDIHLNDHQSKYTLITELRRARAFNPSSHILKRLRKHGYSEVNGGRREARRMAVLFVDDRMSSAKDVFLEARRATYNDIELFVVAIGDKYDKDEIGRLASHPLEKHIFITDSYESLIESTPEFRDLICADL